MAAAKIVSELQQITAELSKGHEPSSLVTLTEQLRPLVYAAQQTLGKSAATGDSLQAEAIWQCSCVIWNAAATLFPTSEEQQQKHALAWLKQFAW
jgi:hypothetical protein